MKREINVEKLIIDNYTTEEVLAFICNGTEEYIGQIDAKLDMYLKVLRRLNDKLNGNKATKVL